MHFVFFLTVLCTFLSFSSAFVGYGIEMYQPYCAYACRAAIEHAKLSCSVDKGHGGMNMSGMDMGGMDMGHMEMEDSVKTTPECRANNTAFLETLGWCIRNTCAKFNIEAWKLEKYWDDEATGNATVPPKWTYGEAVRQVLLPPTAILNATTGFNNTVLVPYLEWYKQFQTLRVFQKQEKTNSKYGIIVLVTGFGTPIFLTMLAYLPITGGLFPKLKTSLIYPSVIKSFHARPLPYFLGYAPTLGQSLYIFAFVVLNVVLTATRYRSSQPSAWFDNSWEEMMSYVSARTGVLAFAISPLVILFAGRNNILLWLTNWPHSTFILLHRWVARVMGVQVILHSVLELVLYIKKGTYAKEAAGLYWVWGAVGTVACSLMLVLSCLYFRRTAYDLFLVIHVILAVLFLMGSWYHVDLRFERKWGYEFWLYAAFAVWIFDRTLRVLRIARVGIKRSKVMDVGGGIVRVDIPGVRWGGSPGMHAYAFFPALGNWKPWENHPFSVVPTSLLLRGDSFPATPRQNDVDKIVNLYRVSEVPYGRGDTSTTAGVTLYIRKSKGMTSFLRSHDSLPTLLDGPYGHTALSSSNTILKCDRLILIAGGIGITAILPFISSHPNIKFAWSMKKEMWAMADEFSHVLDRLEEKEKTVVVGGRIDLQSLIREEIGRGWNRIGVIVCGPGAMGDAARSHVTQLGKDGVMVELLVESFGW